MNLGDVVERKVPPEPWAEGEKIPWQHPEFSSRMLQEHLSQDHDAASRRYEIIDQHIDWIHTVILNKESTRILDLCCGPGLYTSRFAKLGHSCVGIDYAPASIAYAREQMEERSDDCRYIEADVRDVEFGSGYGLVMMIHGELNVFRPEEISRILEKGSNSLADGGCLVIEAHTLEAVQAIGEQGPKWYTTNIGLFSEKPHLLLKEAFWDAGLKVAQERYYVVDAQSGEVTQHAASIQGFDSDEYVSLVHSCGYGEIQKHESLGGKEGEKAKNYVVYVAKKGLQAA